MDNTIVLSFLMLERVGLILILACLLVGIRSFREVLFDNHTASARVRLILIFSLFAIFANITGVAIDPDNNIQASGFILNLPKGYSIANTRLLAVTTSGIIGGPVVGGIVGAVAGIHRMIQGDIAGWFYVPSSILVGLLSGFLFQNHLHDQDERTISPTRGFLIGLLMETIQMGFALFFSPTKLTLVSFAFGPMVFFNSLGTYLFLLIINMILNQEQDARAVQTHDVLTLANQTLPYFREGLNFQSAQHSTAIIKAHTNFSAISITANNVVLSFLGDGSDHHIVGGELTTQLSRKVMATNQVVFAKSKAEIGCSDPNCHLHAAISVPLDIDDKMIGSLNFYFTNAKSLDTVAEELATGLATIFSSQLELGHAEDQSKLVKEAEIKSLQAQINPHFFFNAMNTISIMVRKDPVKARELMLSLSTYFRANLAGVRDIEISISKEIEYVNAYLELEEARFPDKFEIKIWNHVDESRLIPPFTIQILIDNAIKHGFDTRKTNNHVDVTINRIRDNLQLVVVDNGSGIPPDIIDKLGQQNMCSKTGSGTALYNLNQRLIGLYGEDSKLQIESKVGKGTRFTILIPVKETNNENLNSWWWTLAREDLHYLIDELGIAEEIDEAESIENAMINLTHERYDILFLDIQLGNETGFTLAERIHELDKPIQIIFATAYEQFALDAFNVDAVDYLLKPFDKKRVEKALDKAQQRIKARKLTLAEGEVKPKFPSKVSLLCSGKTHLFDIHNIIYLESRLGEVIIITKHGEWKTKKPLTTIKKQLDPAFFLQVHRSVIVNIDQIISLEPAENHNYTLTLQQGKKITVARTYVKDVKKRLQI